MHIEFFESVRNFTQTIDKLKQERMESPAPSCLSMKRTKSMYPPLQFRDGLLHDLRLKQERMESPAPSGLSRKRSKSMYPPLQFREGLLHDLRLKQERMESPAPSCLSMKSTKSMDPPLKFREGLLHDLSRFRASLLTEDQFRCSVCSEVLKDPVSIPCGHSYCRECISTYWAQPGLAGDYRCPQCSKSLRTRPELSINTALARVVQVLQQEGFSPARPAQPYAGAGDVPCDICSGRKLRAVKTCLTCSASYCETHVRQHYTVPALQRHSLVEVTGDQTHTLQQDSTVKMEIKEEENIKKQIKGDTIKINKKRKSQIIEEDDGNAELSAQNKKRTLEKSEPEEPSNNFELGISGEKCHYLQMENNNLGSLFTGVKEETTELSQLCTSLELENQNLNVENDELRNLCFDLKQENCILRSLSKSLVQENVEHKEAIVKLNNCLTGLKLENQKQRQEMVELNYPYSGLKQENQKLDLEITELRQLCLDLKTKMKNLYCFYIGLKKENIQQKHETANLGSVSSCLIQESYKCINIISELKKGMTLLHLEAFIANNLLDFRTMDMKKITSQLISDLEHQTDSQVTGSELWMELEIADCVDVPTLSQPNNLGMLDDSWMDTLEVQELIDS